MVCDGFRALPIYSVHWDSSNAKALLAITKCLEETHLFKLKRRGLLKYHLGCDDFRDDTGTL
jgi:hypothetical protein